MHELIEQARREGMTFTLGDGDRVTVKGNWQTPNARTLRNALTTQKPLVLAWLRDITSYVGEEVTAPVWMAVQQRAQAQGWEVEGEAVKGGARITAVRGRVIPSAEEAAYRAPGEQPAQPALIDVPAKRVYA